jgi:hypothetical protein
VQVRALPLHITPITWASLPGGCSDFCRSAAMPEQGPSEPRTMRTVSTLPGLRLPSVTLGSGMASIARRAAVVKAVMQVLPHSEDADEVYGRSNRRSSA